jgi:hypothetical protein
VSFNGKYMTHKCSRVGNKSRDNQTRGNGEDYFSSSGHEMLKMSITQTDTNVHGPAFIEVYNAEDYLSIVVPFILKFQVLILQFMHQKKLVLGIL